MDQITHLYLFLLIAFVGFCLLFLSGYLQFKGKNEVMLYLIGSIAIGVGFINISSVSIEDINPFVIFIWACIHLFISWLIVDGSARFFIRIKERNEQKTNESVKKDPDKWFN